MKLASHSDHRGFNSQTNWVPPASYTAPTSVPLGSYRSFAHAIRNVEEILQPPRGGDDHDESPASWHHQPSPIHRAQVVASRGGTRKEWTVFSAGQGAVALAAPSAL